MKKKIIWSVIILLIVVLDYFYSYVDREMKIYSANVDSGRYGNIGEITSNSKVVQEFICNKDNLCSISFRVSTMSRGEERIKLKYTLKNVAANEVISEGILDSATLVNNKFAQITFAKQVDSENQIYRITFEAPEVAVGEGITIYTTEPSDDNISLENNGVESDQSLVFRYITNGFDVETFIMLIIYEVLMLVFIRSLYKFLV